MLFPYFILNPLIILLIVLFPQIIFKFLALLIIGVLSACASRIILLIMETIIASVMKIPKKRGWVANSLVSFIQAVNIGPSESLSKVAIPDFAISNWRGKMLEVMWQTMYQVPKLADCLNGQVDKNPLLLYVYLTWVKTLSPQKWEEYVLTNLWWATEFCKTCHTMTLSSKMMRGKLKSMQKTILENFSSWRFSQKWEGN